MGYLSDSLNFEKFFAKDLIKGIKKDPKRLILGVDPASTWAWNKFLGRDDKPLVDQMGGPYDGRVLSFGHDGGGVYDRAAAAGVDTDAAHLNHNIAHIIAGSYALGGAGLGGGGSAGSAGLGEGGGSGLGAAGVGAADALPTVTVTGTAGGLGTPAYFAGAGAASAAGANGSLTNQTSSDVWNRAFAPENSTNFSTGMTGSANPAEGIPGINGPIGGGASAAPSTTDYAKLGMKLMGSGNQQQQQQPMMYIDHDRPAAQTPTAAPTADPTLSQRINGGLGRVGNTLFPVDAQAAQALGPEYVKQAQSNALLRLGLGMAAAGRQPGGTFGGALASGLGNASTDLNGAMQTAYQNARQARADKRADTREDREVQREDRLDARQQYQEDHLLGRETIADQRYKEEQQFRADQASRAQQQWGAEQKLREQAFNQRGLGQVPTGYRYNAQGNLEFIPGGPADPSVASSNKTLRPIPSSAAKGIIENRASLKQIDRALAAVEKSPDAFGMQNYLPDMVTQRLGGGGFSGGLEARAQVADIGSLKLHDRSGAAITAAEFPRLQPFIPQATDDPATVKKKLENLKANLETMQDEIESFYTPDAGYRPLQGEAKPDPLGIR